jgi:NAD(P)H-flavin reductase
MFNNFKGLKNKNIIEIDEINNVKDDYYTIKFKIDEKIKWRPGEHGIFSISDENLKGKKWRAFSVASIPPVLGNSELLALTIVTTPPTVTFTSVYLMP